MARKWVRTGSRGGPNEELLVFLDAGLGESDGASVTVSGKDYEAVEEVVRLVENGALASAAFAEHMAGRRISYFISYAYRHPETGLPAFGCSSVGVDFPGLERFDQVAGIAAQISETVGAHVVVLSWQRCDPPLVVAPVVAGPRLVS